MIISLSSIGFHTDCCVWWAATLLCMNTSEKMESSSSAVVGTTFIMYLSVLLARVLICQRFIRDLVLWLTDSKRDTVDLVGDLYLERRMRSQIVLFGDSITEQSFRAGGWGAGLADTYSRKADVVVRGYGGYNTRCALFLVNHLFPLGCPTPHIAVTIFFGANDAALLGRTSERQHVPIEEYKENLRKIVHHLKECSKTLSIILITPPPVDESGRQAYARLLYGDNAAELPERTNEMAGVYAEACCAVAKDLGVFSIDLWSKMQETEGWQKKFLSDGLHLTAEGNALVHSEVVRVLNAAGLRASEMPYDFPHHSEIDPEKPHEAFQLRTL